MIFVRISTGNSIIDRGVVAITPINIKDARYLNLNSLKLVKYKFL